MPPDNGSEFKNSCVKIVQSWWIGIGSLKVVNGDAVSNTSLTLGAHAPEGYGSWVCVSRRLSVCLLLINISLFQCSFVSKTIRLT